MDTDHTFEAAWREMKPRIERLLYSRGARSDVVDDVTQETGIKLLSHWSRVDPSRPLWPLARTIATNCLVDQFRQSQPEPVAEVPDGPAAYDVEEHGLARARLGVVARTIRSLRPADRSVLLAQVGEEVTRGEGSAQKMARLRARRRLSEALERSAAAFSGVQLSCRRLFAWVQHQGAAGVEATFPAVAGAAIAVSAAFGLARPDVPAPAAPVHAQQASGHADAPDPSAHREGAKARARGAAPAHATGTTTSAASRSGGSSEGAGGTPRPAPEPPQETKVAEVAGKSAKTGGDDRYRYVVVCAEESGGPADRDLTVSYGEDESYEEASQDHCD